MSSKGGWEGSIRVATSEAGLSTASDEAKVQSVNPTHGPNMKTLRELGSRSPTEIKAGNIDIGLSLEVHYVPGSEWPGRCGVGSTGEHTEYYVGIYPEKYGSGKPKIVLQGKFGNWSLSMDQDGIATESIEFVGKAINVGTV